MNLASVVAQVSKPAVSPTSKSAARWSSDGLRIWKSATQPSAAKPQSKERGVYAASTLEVQQAVKREEGLKNSNAEAA